jgi:hypothetical protein
MIASVHRIHRRFGSLMYARSRVTAANAADLLPGCAGGRVAIVMSSVRHRAP